MQDTNSNWSSGLSLWDRLHGTLRARAPDDSIRIGAPNLRVEDGDLQVSSSLMLPFQMEASDRDL